MSRRVEILTDNLICTFSGDSLESAELFFPIIREFVDVTDLVKSNDDLMRLVNAEYDSKDWEDIELQDEAERQIKDI